MPHHSNARTWTKTKYRLKTRLLSISWFLKTKRKPRMIVCEWRTDQSDERWNHPRDRKSDQLLTRRRFENKHENESDSQLETIENKLEVKHNTTHHRRSPPMQASETLFWIWRPFPRQRSRAGRPIRPSGRSVRPSTLNCPFKFAVSFSSDKNTTLMGGRFLSEHQKKSSGGLSPIVHSRPFAFIVDFCTTNKTVTSVSNHRSRPKVSRTICWASHFFCHCIFGCWVLFRESHQPQFPFP